MEILGEFERERLTVQQKEVVAIKRARGESLGSIPYGFSIGPDGKTLHRNESRTAKHPEDCCHAGKRHVIPHDLRRIGADWHQNQQWMQVASPTLRDVIERHYESNA